MNACQSGALVALALAVSILAGCESAPPPVEEQPITLTPEPPEVVFFYARPPEVVRGENMTMCYSLREADVVSIEPPIRDLHPSISYCFNYAPRERDLHAYGQRGGR